MESTGLLLLIFGLWVAVVIPLWWRERQSASVNQVKIFRSAMQHLRDGQVLPKAPATGSVNYKRAPKVGAVSDLRERGLRRRRAGFVMALLTLPVATALHLSGFAPVEIWVLPPLAVATFVAYARYSMSQLRKVQAMVSQTSAPIPNLSAAATKTTAGGTLTAGLSALRKIAMRRLVETEPQVKPEAAAAWQPASEFGSPWSAPTPILPSYVSKPSPSEAVEQNASVPLPGVDGNALLVAAKAQRDAERELAAIAEQVAATNSKSPEVLADDDTSEIIRIIGA